MDVVGSEIGQKMRSAIKAKLTELGCYVDDELPDYVMVMVANKRTRSQMDEDLQLFLGDNTELFVNWLHQVLKKLQEVTVTAPLDAEKIKEKTKEIKSKEKKDKSKLKKLESVKEKKLKKKDKEKSHKKKDKHEKKGHKSKKKSKHHEMIRPNIPPLLMNIEKESEPSITDVFAGQILKNHGVIIDSPKEEKEDMKPVISEISRPIKPIIDPATISQLDAEVVEPETSQTVTEETQDKITDNVEDEVVILGGAPREEQIKEINEIEAKIHGLKQKLAEQLDSMSDDEDFLNIRTEAEELMNDFAEDVFQEISAQAPAATPHVEKSPNPPTQTVPKPIIETKPPPEILPQIELNLPKRPIRERLGVKSVADIDREVIKKVPEARNEVKEKEDNRRTETPERYTPEREPDFWPKSVKTRLGSVSEKSKKHSFSDESEKSDDVSKKHASSRKSPPGPGRARGCASVVVVRPRPRVAPASALLLRAVADAHRSQAEAPPKLSAEPHQVKRAMVLPMRRCVESQKIVIQLQGADKARPEETDRGYKMLKNTDNKEEYVPASITKKIHNTDYVPSRRPERTYNRRDEPPIIDTINIHNTTVDKDKNTQFIVTMDGFNPNSFLAKKLQTEGLLNDEDELINKPIKTKPVLRTKETVAKSKDLEITEKYSHNSEVTSPRAEIIKEKSVDIDKTDEVLEKAKTCALQNKRLSNTSDESDTQIIIHQETSMIDRETYKNEKRKDDGVEKRNSSEDMDVSENTKAKKRKASPIVFDFKKDKVERARTESASSDNQVTVTTAAANKYDAVPSLSACGLGAAAAPAWCRAFPQCVFGAGCVFQHPRCKFSAACTRRACVYHHPARPATLASHVVPVASFKSITPTAVPSVCKYYPSCSNPTCHFYHPKPCRYGKACVNKLECNFYHSDIPSNKFRYPV